jgi:hypothetical protein
VVFSAILKYPVRLVYMPEEAIEEVDPLILLFQHTTSIRFGWISFFNHWAIVFWMI